MTKALRSFPEDRRTAIATRRLNNGINGLRGNVFWAAKDYFDKKGMRLPGKLGTEQSLSEALERMENGSGFSTGGPTGFRNRDRRDQGDGGDNRTSSGKSPRRDSRRVGGKSSGRTDTGGMEVSKPRRNFQPVGGRRNTPSRKPYIHDNKPRIVRGK